MPHPSSHFYFDINFGNKLYSKEKKPGPNVSTTPIKAMGCRQCLLLSAVQMKGKHCQKPHCRNGDVDTFGLGLPGGTFWKRIDNSGHSAVVCSTILPWPS